MKYHMSLLLLVVLFFMGESCETHERKNTTRSFYELSEFNQKKFHKGQKLFTTYCSFCHGEQGNAQGLNAGNLKKKPADLTKIGKDRKKTDDYLFTIIKYGGKRFNKSEEMPHFDQTLTDEEIYFLVKFYIRELSNE